MVHGRDHMKFVENLERVLARTVMRVICCKHFCVLTQLLVEVVNTQLKLVNCSLFYYSFQLHFGVPFTIRFPLNFLTLCLLCLMIWTKVHYPISAAHKNDV